MAKTYYEKLKDPRWQKLRLEVMSRDEFKCRCCHAATETLNVHHAFYAKGRDPWDYESHTLHTLCESCHHRITLDKQEIDQWLCVSSDNHAAVMGIIKSSKSDSWSADGACQAATLFLMTLGCILDCDRPEHTAFLANMLETEGESLIRKIEDATRWAKERAVKQASGKISQPES